MPLKYYARNALAALAVASSISLMPGLVSAQEPSQPNEQMQTVLDKLKELGAKPLHTLSVEEARSQPTPADAVMAVMEDQGIEPDPELASIQTEDITIPGPAGEIQARVYTPEGEGPFPVVVYYHGGGG